MSNTVKYCCWCDGLLALGLTCDFVEVCVDHDKKVITLKPCTHDGLAPDEDIDPSKIAAGLLSDLRIDITLAEPEPYAVIVLWNRPRLIKITREFVYESLPAPPEYPTTFPKARAVSTWDWDRGPKE